MLQSNLQSMFGQIGLTYQADVEFDLSSRRMLNPVHEFHSDLHSIPMLFGNLHSAPMLNRDLHSIPMLNSDLHSAFMQIVLA